MGSKVRIVGRVMAVGVLAVLMSACLKLDMNLNVSSDNTVSGSVIFAVEKSLLELSGQSFDDILGSSAPLPSDAEGVSVTDYEDDQFAGKEYTFDSVPLAQFAGDSSGQLSITRDGDVFHVSGTLDLSSVGATGPSGLSGFDPGQFLQGAELKIQITFPGEVTESNGEISGNSVTWVPVIGESLDLQATAKCDRERRKRLEPHDAADHRGRGGRDRRGDRGRRLAAAQAGRRDRGPGDGRRVLAAERRADARGTAERGPTERAAAERRRPQRRARSHRARAAERGADATGARLAPAPASARSRAAVASGRRHPGHVRPGWRPRTPRRIPSRSSPRGGG